MTIGRSCTSRRNWSCDKPPLHHRDLKCTCVDGSVTCYGSPPSGERISSEEAVGIAIAVIITVCVIAFAGYFCYKKKTMMSVKVPTEADAINVEIPKGSDVVKTSKHKELPPNDPDWLYVRTASMVRKIYIRAGMGVGAFRKVYGGQKRRGTCTKIFTTGSGKIVRYILQQLEEMGLVEQDEEGGRKITKEGQRELDTVAVQAAGEEDEENED